MTIARLSPPLSVQASERRRRAGFVGTKGGKDCAQFCAYHLPGWSKLE